MLDCCISFKWLVLNNILAYPLTCFSLLAKISVKQLEKKEKYSHKSTLSPSTPVFCFG